MEIGTRRMEKKVIPSYFIQRWDERHPPKKRMRPLRRNIPLSRRGRSIQPRRCTCSLPCGKGEERSSSPPEIQREDISLSPLLFCAFESLRGRGRKLRGRRDFLHREGVK